MGENPNILLGVNKRECSMKVGEENINTARIRCGFPSFHKPQDEAVPIRTLHVIRTKVNAWRGSCLLHIHPISEQCSCKKTEVNVQLVTRQETPISTLRRVTNGVLLFGETVCFARTWFVPILRQICRRSSGAIMPRQRSRSLQGRMLSLRRSPKNHLNAVYHSPKTSLHACVRRRKYAPKHTVPRNICQ